MTLGATVLVVHHTGKNNQDSARGASAIEGNADCVFHLKRIHGDDDRVELSVKHTKDSERSGALIFTPRVVELGVSDSEGESLSSLVMDLELSDRQNTVMHETKAGRTQRAVAEMLGVSRNVVAREIYRLRKMGFL